MLDLISFGSPSEAMRSKWTELPSIREAVGAFLAKRALPVSGIAQRFFSTYKTFCPNSQGETSILGTIFSGLTIARLGMAIPSSLSDLKNAVQRTYLSIQRQDLQNALYQGFVEIPMKLAGALFIFSRFLGKLLPARFLSNRLAFLSPLGQSSLCVLFVFCLINLGLLNKTDRFRGKGEFEEILASLSDSKPEASKARKMKTSSNSAEKIVKFFGLKEIASELEIDERAVSKAWEKHQSQKIDGYLAKIVFGTEIPEETVEQRRQRFQERKESFIRWTSLECYKEVAKWLGVPLSPEDSLPYATESIQIGTHPADPETLRSRMELLANILRASFKATVTAYFESFTATLSAGAMLVLLSSKFILFSGSAAIILLLLSITQFQKSYVKDLIISQFQTDLPG